jgi:hypothetical protein
MRAHIGLVVLLAGCHANAGHPSVDAAPAVAVAASASSSPQVDAGLPPRCSLVPGTPSVSFGEGAELGEAVAVPGGFVLGALRVRDGGRAASVLRVADGPPTSVDLGLVPRDAPAPQPIVRGTDVFALAYVSASGPHVKGAPRPPRALSVFHVGATAERVAQLPSETDASGAFDIIAATRVDGPVGALVAWDDEAGTPPHGVVRVAALSADLRTARSPETIPVASVTPAEVVDAGDPRLTARDGGYWLTYVARRPEHTPSALPLPAGEIETPSEEATFGWIEAVMLDDAGAPKGAAHRLTPGTGHVASYAAWSHDGVVEVVAKDEGFAALGGSLERITWRGEGEPEVHPLVKGGVEEELPPVIVPDTGASAWLSFLSVSGATELVPLAPTAATTPVATREPLLVGARILGVSKGRVALAAATGTRWSLEWSTCTR